jgi:hypothetical protein
MTKRTVYLGMFGIMLGVTLMLAGCATQREAGENETNAIVEGKGYIVSGQAVGIYIDDKLLGSLSGSGAGLYSRMIIPNGTHTIQLKEGLFDGHLSNIITFEAVGGRVDFTAIVDVKKGFLGNIADLELYQKNADGKLSQ